MELDQALLLRILGLEESLDHPLRRRKRQDGQRRKELFLPMSCIGGGNRRVKGSGQETIPAAFRDPARPESETDRPGSQE